MVDADGLNLLARLYPELNDPPHGRWVLTPHPGEFARLIGEDTAAVLADPLPALRRTSAALQATIVLKGHCSYVCAPDGGLWIFDGMNPALATGGSGDVLSGVIAAQLAGGSDDTAVDLLAIRLVWEEALYEACADEIADDWRHARAAHAAPVAPSDTAWRKPVSTTFFAMPITSTHDSITSSGISRARCSAARTASARASFSAAVP